MRSQVMRKSGGHDTTINSFKQLRTSGSLRTLSKYSVVSLQRTILCAYPSFNLFSLCAVTWRLFQLLTIDVLCFLLRISCLFLEHFAPALQPLLQSLFVFTASFIMISITYVRFQHIFTY